VCTRVPPACGAQLVEHVTRNEGVRGSNPRVGSFRQAGFGVSVARTMAESVGTVTFLFTDIEGSTRLVHTLRDGYGDLLHEHRELLREIVARYEGEEVDTQGDAFFFTFKRARDGVLAAAEAQRALAAHAWPD